ADTDDEMSVAFSNTIFGDTFGSSTLAVTTISSRGNVTEETDTLFNTAFTWDSYRGTLRNGVEDFRRVAIHEFGHTLGLDHPDGASPVQHVTAIMNSRESNIEVPQTDDITGVQSLYNSGPAYQGVTSGPVLMNISTRALIGTGENVLIGGFVIQGSQPTTVILRAIAYSLTEGGINGALRDPIITVYNSKQQVMATNDDWFTSSDAQTIASYGLDPHNSSESALYLSLTPDTYTAIVQSYSDSSTPATSGIGLFELYDLRTGGGRAGNVSSRGNVQTGDNVMIAGFIVGSGGNKELIIRALGQSLGSNVSNPLSDPMVSIYNANGVVLQSNDDWQQDPYASTIAARGFAPHFPKESATLITLGPGIYTAIVSGVNGATGVALVEAYDQSASPP
ncbi:MAG: matrixin family metalloprotease, partial [Verrucomicrobiota bacterium]|nr:matrixin family metalloprotease [Verrucomicrobiota bacterium]